MHTYYTQLSQNQIGLIASVAALFWSKDAINSNRKYLDWIGMFFFKFLF